MGGFESACHRNTRGQRLDLVAATQHDLQLDADYRRMADLGIRVAREAVRWPVIEATPGRFDWSTLLAVVHAARRAGVQVMWTLCHYGWPDDLDVFSPLFLKRFASFCGAIARTLRDEGDTAPMITPVNEISFLAWAAGDVAFIWPRAGGRGDELKRVLVRAHLAAVDAFRAVLPDTRVAMAEPLITVVAPRGRPDLAPEAARRSEAQYEAADLITGRREPELGGAPGYLDLVGLNYYHDNQMICPGDEADGALRWDDEPRDPRWRPLHLLLRDARDRYARPIFIAETSHFGSGRARWLREVASETELARRSGVDVNGICLYPIVDRPDWEDGTHWHNSGLWDVVREPDGTLRRVLDEDYAAALRDAQVLLG
jgi:beta-glucosidase/6-phospho-beta-glucosidase/beta-galactosidase